MERAFPENRKIILLPTAATLSLEEDKNGAAEALESSRGAGTGRFENMEIPYIDTIATGENINQLRARAGLSVRDIQLAFGFASPQAIYKWLHGTALLTIDNLVILAAILDVTLDEIVVVRKNVIGKCG